MRSDNLQLPCRDGCPALLGTLPASRGGGPACPVKKIASPSIPASLCTTSSFLTNTMVILFEMVIMAEMVIMFKMVIMVEMVIMVLMVFIVARVIMVNNRSDI